MCLVYRADLTLSSLAIVNAFIISILQVWNVYSGWPFIVDQLVVPYRWLFSEREHSLTLAVSEASSELLMISWFKMHPVFIELFKMIKTENLSLSSGVLLFQGLVRYWSFSDFSSQKVLIVKLHSHCFKC